MAHPLGTYKARRSHYRTIRAARRTAMQAERTKRAMITKIMAANNDRADWSRAYNTNLVGWTVADGHPVRV